MDKRIEDLDLGRFSEKIVKSKLTLNTDGTFDYRGTLDFSNMNLNSLLEIPIRFKKVSGGFYCYHNQLTSLKYAPSYVGETFWCSSNRLISLQYGPKEVNKFSCYGNYLFSTVHFSTVIGEFDYYPNHNQSYHSNKIIEIIKEMSNEQRYDELKFFERNDYEAYNKMLKILKDYNLPFEEFKPCYTIK